MLGKKLRAAGGGGSIPLEFSLEHTASQDTNSRTNTYLSCALGTADTNREIWVTLSADFDGSASYSPSCTIGGVSATQILEWPSAGNGKGVAIFRLNVQSGTSADIVVDSGQLAFNSTSIAVYRLVGYETVEDSSWTSSTYTTDISLSPDSNDSVVLATIVSAANNATWTYSNLTRDYNPTPNANNTWTHFSASGVTSGAKTFFQSGGGTGTFHGAAVAIPPLAG